MSLSTQSTIRSPPPSWSSSVGPGRRPANAPANRFPPSGRALDTLTPRRAASPVTPSAVTGGCASIRAAMRTGFKTARGLLGRRRIRARGAAEMPANCERTGNALCARRSGTSTAAAKTSGRMSRTLNGICGGTDVGPIRDRSRNAPPRNIDPFGSSLSRMGRAAAACSRRFPFKLCRQRRAGGQCLQCRCDPRGKVSGVGPKYGPATPLSVRDRSPSLGATGGMLVGPTQEEDR